MEIKTLKIMLAEWVDLDLAEYYLAQSLGLMDETVTFYTDAKHVFWSDNPIGKMLANIMDELVANKILEYREEPDYQYRWNKDFRGSWE